MTEPTWSLRIFWSGKEVRNWWSHHQRHGGNELHRKQHIQKKRKEIANSLITLSHFMCQTRSLMSTDKKKKNMSSYRSYDSKKGGIDDTTIRTACSHHPVVCASIGKSAFTLFRNKEAFQRLNEGKSINGDLIKQIVEIVVKIIGWVITRESCSRFSTTICTADIRDTLVQLELESFWLECIGLTNSSSMLDSDESLRNAILELLKLVGISESDAQDKSKLTALIQERFLLLLTFAMAKKRGDTKAEQKAVSQLRKMGVSVYQIVERFKECPLWNPARIGDIREAIMGPSSSMRRQMKGFY